MVKRGRETDRQTEKEELARERDRDRAKEK